MSGDPTVTAVPSDVIEENVPDRAAQVLGWRIEQLVAVGFEADAAFVLALDRTVDLHEATELVRRGCPPATALRILV